MQIGCASFIFEMTIHNKMNHLILSSNIIKGGKNSAVDLTGNLIKPVS